MQERKREMQNIRRKEKRTVKSERKGREKGGKKERTVVKKSTKVQVVEMEW